MKIINSLFIAWLVATPVRGEGALYVVVNADNAIQSLSHPELVDIFMGRNNTFPNGQPATVFDNDSLEGIRALFYRQLVDRSESQVNSYWARLQFSGRVTRPEELGSEPDLELKMRATPSAITFVREDQLTNSLKVVYRFDPQ